MWDLLGKGRGQLLQDVSLTVQSRILGVGRISALLGLPPTSAAEAGTPVSSRQVDGPHYEVTTWSRSSMADGEELEGHLAALGVAIAGLSRAREEDPDLVADLVLMLESAPLGAMFYLDAEQVKRLASAGCGVVVDAYETDPG